MLNNIHVFETRNVNFLKPYVDKAKSLGFNVNVIDDPHLETDPLFNEFISVYQHNSVNTPEFEIACFARYFAIASALKNDNPFLLTDTDVYVSNSFKNLQGADFKGKFVGSEGFNSAGSVEQISPHCTVWNRELLLNFIQFFIGFYKQSHEDNFLRDYYAGLKAKNAYAAVSDMNLLYLWIKANNIPFVNSNSTKFEYGIDHNLATVICEDDEFISFADRKYLKVRGDKITCSLKSGKKMDMALLHFQGPYKSILKRFYLKRYTKFIHFTLRNNYRHHKKIFSKKDE